MRRFASLLLGVSLCAVAGMASAQDPIKVAGSVYKVLLDNARVRVMEATIAPGVKVPAHSHPDHLGYVVEAGTLNLTGADGKVNTMELKVGQAVWIPAETHSTENPGKTTVKVLVVEVKDAAAPMPATAPAKK